MADTLTLTVQSTLVGGSISRSLTISQAATQQLVAWATNNLPGLFTTDANGNPIPIPNPTPAQIVTALAAFMVQEIVTKEYSWRQQQVAQAASPAITATPQ